jgi:hypothetical protein
VIALEAGRRRAAQQILAFRMAIVLAFPGEDLTTYDLLADVQARADA